MEKISPLLLLFLLSLTSISAALDSISAAQSVRDGGPTLISAGGFFELGFFSIKSNRYLGIWFKKISNGTTVWVANRETPLSNSTGLFTFDSRGNLILLNQENNLTVWSGNSSKPARNPVAQLLDSGNLVIREENEIDPDKYLWQSFYHADKTFIPGMKIGRLAGGQDVHLSCWKSADDPTKGEYIYELDPTGLQMVVSKNSIFSARSGPWNGIGYSGMPYLKPNPIFNYSFITSEKGTYYTFELMNTSVFTRVELNPKGVMDRYAWIDRTQQWNLISSAPADNCDMYDICGPHGSCDISNAPVCSCLDKFVPNNRNEWGRADWTGGCIRRTPLDCKNGDGFVKYINVKSPDMLNYTIDSSLTMEECRTTCLNNCSCMAYASSNIVTGRGCYFWFGDLLDIKQYYDEGGQDLYIRMALSELVESPSSSGKGKQKVIIASLVSSALMFLLVLCLGLWIRNKKRKKQQNAQASWERYEEESYSFDNHDEELELPHFDISVVAKATDNFSFNHLLGEGGFGPVYKGTLKDGQEIAVKRLSKESRQGLDEFKNEVKCIAKLQHRNLVKLLGYCVHLDERILIYEYMPNKSLDLYIFDESRSKQLDWSIRFRIINGISRGLLYLHQDSRLRIIHRDLKLSNVLLDNELNPKISDFGMARSFGGNETAANTKRVVGTYGYMAPEYAIDGLFSVKSDVFSFGVLVLEIISGKKNRGFTHPDHQLNLLGHAWKLLKDGRYQELVDELMTESCDFSQVLRTVHVGLLCVQQDPDDRPSMSSVVLMLSSEGPLPEPKEPGFFTERKMYEGETSSSKQESCSINDMTITLIDVR
ncbi:G-type lectin S-receptor-like serine/threonine-protein kinase At4g27290 [Mercurialis annua]|uniref:G-type lectin S-receptor-like serine/threonine-protein kinase At4g27290 n=1 Tax=Mercurialis annua TaxID=3986 RepID=UPI00215ECB3A|nr:G-type lectin S-receptor-like serine/threonine-protein kinase At4g27290 [Mercurialis annua]